MYTTRLSLWVSSRRGWTDGPNGWVRNERDVWWAIYQYDNQKNPKPAITRGYTPSIFHLDSCPAMDSSPQKENDPVPCPWTILRSSSHQFKDVAPDLRVSKRPELATECDTRGGVENFAFVGRFLREWIGMLWNTYDCIQHRCMQS